MRGGVAAVPVSDRVEPAPRLVAAVDLGSNSFHLIVARVEDGAVQVIDRLREAVRLAGGLSEDGVLSPDAMERGLRCLERFGQRLRDMSRDQVRAVATNTLRQASNGETFRRAAEKALGHGIEVIAGREEARLIYLGVARGFSDKGRRHLVADIGGGSTELIIGRGDDPLLLESLQAGCVGLSGRFFTAGAIDERSMRQAEMAARIELEPVESSFRRAGWERAVGSSGTVKAIAALVWEEGWCDGAITREAVAKLRRKLIAAGSMDKVRFSGLRDDRKPVLPGGVAILGALMQSLDLERMSVSDLALREGVLYDLLDPAHHDDVREASVAKLCAVYRVDRRQAARVEKTALSLLRLVKDAWGLKERHNADALAWAARLHEIGLAVTHSQYHKVGAFLLQHGDLPGFSRQEQAVISALVRWHRRKISSEAFADLPGRAAAFRLCVLLRLAVALHRSRSGGRLPRIRLVAQEHGLGLSFPGRWFAKHPLTRADLDLESDYLRAVGFSLTAS